MQLFPGIEKRQLIFARREVKHNMQVNNELSPVLFPCDADRNENDPVTPQITSCLVCFSYGHIIVQISCWHVFILVVNSSFLKLSFPDWAKFPTVMGVNETLIPPATHTHRDLRAGATAGQIFL